MLRRKKTNSNIPERKRLEILYDRYRTEYESALNRSYRKLRKVLIKTKINFTIKYRLKTFDSYFEKIIRHRQNKTDPIVISDLIGLRVVVPFLEDVQQVKELLTREFKVIEIEYKGKNNSFREFSYDSIHLLITLPEENKIPTIPYVRKVCEIQLRTILQDAWAEVEHELIYKADFSVLNEPIKRKLASLNASLTLSDIIFQEIRDYQKSIARWQKKRHDRFIQKAQQENDLTFVDQMHNPQLGEKEKQLFLDPLRPKEAVEKQIFDALEAHSNKNYRKAIKLYSKILHQKIPPQMRSIVYNHRGMAYFILSDYDRSLKDFSKALEYEPKNVIILNNRGLAFRMLHQYEQALRDFERSVKINPFQHETYHVRALTYYDMNDFSKSFEECNKTLNIKPDFEAAQHLKEILASKIGF